MNSQKNKIIAVVIFSVVALTPTRTVYANSRSLDIVTDADAVPPEVRIACDFWGEQYNICPELLEAIAYHESRFDPSAVNKTCVGIMQINTAAHQKRLERLDVKDIYDMSENIKVAADYLAELFEENEDVAVVLGLYHGEKGAKRRAENGNLSAYVRKILEKSAEFERAHGK